MPARAYVGLGGNVGDRVSTLRSAVTAIATLPDTGLVTASRLYETTAVGPSGEPFLNAAVALDTTLDPHALLDALLSIERAHGRVRRERWGARTLDLDLLAYVDAAGHLVELDTPGLVLPHPHLHERDFVLAPLRDVAPGLVLAGKPVEAHLLALPDDTRTIRAVHESACYVATPQADSSAG